MAQNKNQRGDSLISVMIGAALLGGAAVAGGGVVKLLKKESAFSSVAGTVVAVESQILLGLRSQSSYDAAATASLRAGTGAPGLRLTMNKNGHTVYVASVGSSVSLDRAGEPCAGPSCAMSTKLDVRCASGTCRAAYQIITNAAAAGVTLPVVGSQSATWPPPFPADYDTVISYDLYKRQASEQACPGGELFVSGINRTTGRVSCVRPSTRRLASNQISKSLQYDSATNSIELDMPAYTSPSDGTTYPGPRSLVSATCPAKYRLQAISPGSWENGNGTGQCVYRYQRRVNSWMAPWPSGMQSVSGQVCPSQDYRAVGNGACTFVETGRQNGYCARACPNPNGDGGTYDCSTSPAPVVNPSVSYSASGPNVTCSYSKGYTGDCGADYTGYVSWSGYCEITVPENQSSGTGS